jgi:hypothetical protein
MSRLRRGPVLLALLLGLGASAAAVVDLLGPEPDRSLLRGAEAARALDLLGRAAGALVEDQRADGGFDPWPDDPRRPEVQRTRATALAAAALVEALRLAPPGPSPEALRAARDRALDHLLARQEEGGGFGIMPIGPIGRPDRWPGVETLLAAVHAFVRAERPGDGVALDRAVRALAREAAGSLRNGWVRALGAMTVDALVRANRAGALGLAPRNLIKAEEGAVPRDCSDWRLAEAMVRLLRDAGPGDPFPAAVLEACLAESLAWTHQFSDLQSWWMQAWLAARHPGGERWLRAALDPLEEAMGPEGRVPEGIYADGVIQTAGAVLVLAEALGAGRPPPAGRSP